MEDGSDGRRQNIFHSLVHSLNGCNSQEWDTLKSRIKNSIQVSDIHGINIAMKVWAFLYYFSEKLAGNQIRSRTSGTPNVSDFLMLCAKTLSLPRCFVHIVATEYKFDSIF